MQSTNDPYKIGAIEEDISFVDLLQAMIDLMYQGERVGNPKGVEWLGLAHSQSRKILTHLMSILYLRNGTNLFMLRYKSSHIQFLDHESVAVLSRSAIEGYLLFYRIFVSSSTEEEKAFLIKIWSLGDRLTRRKLPAYSTTGQTNIQTLEQESENLIADIEQSPLFGSLTTKEQKAATKKGDWRLGWSWRKIAVEAGFPEKFFVGVYGMLSSSAHSGKTSIHILQASITTEAQLDRFVMPLRYGLMILGRMIEEYPKLFQGAAIEPPPQSIQDKAYMWRGVLKEM